MKVVLTSHGSTGDIYPLIAYGRALLEADHQVAYATAPLYREEIEKAGMEFIHLPPDWEQEIFVECMRELDRANNPLALLRQIYKDATPFLSELVDMLDAALADADVLVASYLFPHYKVIAERRNIPFVVFSFCHEYMPSTSETPKPFPALSFLPKLFQERWNRLCWHLADRIVVWNINNVIGNELKKKNLRLVDSFFSRPADLCLLAMSGALMAPQGEYDPVFKFTGYLRWQAPLDEQMEQELQDFCQGEEVPVLTFGSVAFDNVHGLMSRFLHQWPVGKKLIIQSGWAGLSIELPRPEIKVIGKMSHDQLFRFASCVCHHGGAGTTASVLHSGKPHIIIPHIADQPFWARKIKELGCGVTVHKKHWPERLSETVRQVESSPEMRRNAEKCAEILKNENGPRTAVRLLEEFVQQS